MLEIWENARVETMELLLAGKGTAGARQTQNPENTLRSKHRNYEQIIWRRLELLEIHKTIWRGVQGEPHIKYTREGGSQSDTGGTHEDRQVICYPNIQLLITIWTLSSPSGTWMWRWTLACLVAPTVMSFPARRKEAGALGSRSTWVVMAVLTLRLATEMRTPSLLFMRSPSCKHMFWNKSYLNQTEVWTWFFLYTNNKTCWVKSVDLEHTRHLLMGRFQSKQKLVGLFYKWESQPLIGRKTS